MQRKKLTEACREVGINPQTVIEFVRQEWIHPLRALGEAEPDAYELDDEDIARTRLIVELKEEMGVNDEAIPIILYLLDEINAVRTQLRRSHCI